MWASSKALLTALNTTTKRKSSLPHTASRWGLGIDFPQMIARKGEVVSQTTEGINFLMKKNNIDVHQGVGLCRCAHHRSHTRQRRCNPHRREAHHRRHGSKPSSLPFIEVDKKRVITSTEALSLPKLPKSMVVIGGGVIGLELVPSTHDSGLKSMWWNTLTASSP